MLCLYCICIVFALYWQKASHIPHSWKPHGAARSIHSYAEPACVEGEGDDDDDDGDEGYRDGGGDHYIPNSQKSMEQQLQTTFICQAVTLMMVVMLMLMIITMRF